MTITLMRDLVELVEEWARVSAERARLEQDGGEPASVKPAHHATGCRVCNAQDRIVCGAQPRRYDR